MSKLNALRAITKVTKGAAIAAVVTAVIEIAVAWGVYLYSMETSGSLDAIQRDTLLAQAIAATIVAIIYMLLALIPVVGTILLLLLTLFDAIATIVCAIIQSSAYVCNGIRVMLTDAIADVLYDVRMLVDLDDKDRLNFDTDYALTLGLTDSQQPHN